MKKVSFVMLLLVVFGFCVISCSKDKEDEKMTLEGKSFVARGETFTATICGSNYSYTPFYVYRFTSANSYEYIEKENSIYGKISSSKSGTYTLSYPIITFRSYSSEETTTGYFVNKSTIRIGLYEYIQQ